MKKLLILPLFAVSFLLTGCGVSVVDYNDKIYIQTDNCITAENLIWTAMEEENYGMAKTLHATALETCMVAQAEVEAMGAFEDDSSFRDIANEFLQTEVAYLTKYAEALPYRDIEEFTDEERAAYEAINEELSVLEEKGYALNEELLTIQVEFADKHGYELE